MFKISFVSLVSVLWWLFILFALAHAVLSFVVLTKMRLGFRFLLLFVCFHSGFSVLWCLFEIRSSLVFCFSLFVMSLACVPFCQVFVFVLLSLILTRLLPLL